jgi:hypothetical protein
MLTIEEARRVLAIQTYHEQWNYPTLGAHLESLASMFSRTSKDQHRELAAEFHDCAGRLPYLHDCDFGALILEDIADSIDDASLRVWILTEAFFRAKWCIQGASAGGESISRSRHYSRIEEKLKNAEPQR